MLRKLENVKSVALLIPPSFGLSGLFSDFGLPDYPSGYFLNIALILI